MSKSFAQQHSSFASHFVLELAFVHDLHAQVNDHLRNAVLQHVNRHHYFCYPMLMPQASRDTAKALLVGLSRRHERCRSCQRHANHNTGNVF